MIICVCFYSGEHATIVPTPNAQLVYTVATPMRKLIGRVFYSLIWMKSLTLTVPPIQYEQQD